MYVLYATATCCGWGCCNLVHALLHPAVQSSSASMYPISTCRPRRRRRRRRRSPHLIAPPALDSPPRGDDHALPSTLPQPSLDMRAIAIRLHHHSLAHCSNHNIGCIPSRRARIPSALNLPTLNTSFTSLFSSSDVRASAFDLTMLALSNPSIIPTLVHQLRQHLVAVSATAVSTLSHRQLPRSISCQTLLTILFHLVRNVPFFYRYIGCCSFVRALWRLNDRFHFLSHQLSAPMLVAGWVRDLSTFGAPNDPGVKFWTSAYRRLSRRQCLPNSPRATFVYPVHILVDDIFNALTTPRFRFHLSISALVSSLRDAILPFHNHPIAVTDAALNTPDILTHSGTPASANPSSVPIPLAFPSYSPIYNRPYMHARYNHNGSADPDASMAMTVALTTSARDMGPPLANDSAENTLTTSARNLRRVSKLNDKVLAVVRRHDDVFGVTDPYYIAPPTRCSSSFCQEDSTATLMSRSRSTTTTSTISVAALARENARRKISETKCRPTSSLSSSSPWSPLAFTHNPSHSADWVRESEYSRKGLLVEVDSCHLEDLATTTRDAAPPVTPSTFAKLPFVPSSAVQAVMSCEPAEADAHDSLFQTVSSYPCESDPSAGDTVIFPDDTLQHVVSRDAVRNAKSVSMGCRLAHRLNFAYYVRGMSV